MTLQESGTTDTARDSLALALYWLEDVVSQLVRLYGAGEHQNDRPTTHRNIGMLPGTAAHCNYQGLRHLQ